MNESAICCGCYLKKDHPFGKEPLFERGRYDDPVYESYGLVQSSHGLTTQELKILQHTKDIWDEFQKLEDKVGYDNQEMQDAIHRVQQLIALRVARRVDHMVWRQADDAS